MKHIKELKQLQEQIEGLVQSSERVAMGKLIASISHELKQPLTGIKGFAQVALMDLDKKSPLRNDLQKIIEQADRMDEIIRNVRLFARKPGFNLEEFDISKPTKDVLQLLSQQLKLHTIRLKKALQKNVPKIKGDSAPHHSKPRIER